MKIPEDPTNLEQRYLNKLSADFRTQADVLLVVEGEHELPCHSAMLRLHSKVFDEMCAALTTESSVGGTNKLTGRSIPSSWMPLHL